MQFQFLFGKKISKLGVTKLSTIDNTFIVARKIEIKIERNN